MLPVLQNWHLLSLDLYAIHVDRVMTQAAPMSFLMEQAGGMSLTGKTLIMVRV